MDIAEAIDALNECSLYVNDEFSEYCSLLVNLYQQSCIDTVSQFYHRLCDEIIATAEKYRANYDFVTTHSVIIDNLNPEELKQITSLLTNSNIPYRTIKNINQC